MVAIIAQGMVCCYGYMYLFSAAIHVHVTC